MLRTLITTACASCALLAALPAEAQTLDFQGIDLDQPYIFPPFNVDDYYDGGQLPMQSRGPEYGITFQTGIWEAFLGFEYPGAMMAVMNAQTGWISARNGFANQLAFRYGSFDPAVIAIYSGLNGTGTKLAEFSVAATFGAGSSNTSLTSATMYFSGVAQSVVVQSASGSFAFDDMVFGGSAPTSPVPEPASWALMIGGFGLAGAALRRRPQPQVRYA